MPNVLIEEKIMGNSIEGDLLDRQEFIDQVKSIIEIMSAQKKNSCFAINGGWGVGKSFVLKALEQQLGEIQNEEDATDKYLIFHYNCWQYDYYQEPLVAMVASILDTIEDKTHLIPEKQKAKFKGVLKAIGNGLIHKASEFVQERTGINPEEIVNVLKDGKEEAMRTIEENHAYDANFVFKKALVSLQTEISELARHQTLIFIVDELDRCLPEYSIQVLERLHHVFDGLPNVQVVMSVDKAQLTHAIKQIFGKETDVNKYLAKFIKFEIFLDTGSVNDLFDKKFAYYLNFFDFKENSVCFKSDFEEFKSNIFDGIDMRSCIEIIDRCYLLHTLLNKTEEKLDCSYMCVEIFLSILRHCDINTDTLNPGFNMRQLFVKTDQKKPVGGLRFLSEKLCAQNGNDYQYLYQELGFVTIKNRDIWGMLLGCYRRVFHSKNDNYSNRSNRSIFNYAETYYNLLQVIN